MKLPLRYGFPLLLVLLAGLTAVDGLERTVLLVVAMGVALWSALSLPRPPPPEEAEDTLEQQLEVDDEEGWELNGGDPSPGENKGADSHHGEGNFTEDPDKEGTGERD
jgi:hypothetical protein